MADDPLAAALAEIRERAAEHADPKIMDAYRGWCASKSADDVPSLLAAVDAALKLADKYDAESKRLWGQIRDADSRGVPSGSKSIDAAWNGDVAKAIREAIARELTGKATDDA